MKNIKKCLILLLCVLMILPSVLFMVSCGKNATEDTAVQTDAETTAETEKETEAVCPIEDEDMDGYDFHAYEGWFSKNMSVNDFAYKETEQSVIDTAIYRRNTIVESKFDIKITNEQVTCVGTTGSPQGYGVMMKARTSGDTDYDVAVLPVYDLSLLALNNALYDLNSAAPLDLSHTWWDPSSTEGMRIKGMNFFITGDFSVDIFNSTIAFLFNKKIAKEKNIGDLYQMVTDGKWTMDTWMECSKKVLDDLNGDSLYTDKDLYGTLVWDDAIYSVVSGAGEHCCVTDKNGDLVLTIGTERVVSAYKTYADFVLFENYALRYQQTFNANGTPTFNSGSPLEFSMFPENKGLFMFTWLGVSNKFRDMETDYGFLPTFKYDEDQDSYYNSVSPYNARFLCMPYNLDDSERTAKILETIGYYSQKYVMPAYYDKMLYGTIMRDDESLPMLQIIHDTRVYDLGYFYQPANINKNLLYVFRDSSSAWATRYASMEIQANAKLDEMNGIFDDLSEIWHK